MLEQCRSKVGDIIRELERIEQGIRGDFTGIGEKVCADAVGEIISKYKGIRTDLNNMDESIFKKAGDFFEDVGDFISGIFS
ncbi:MAG: hypothetical protein LBS19_01245 [Clostridiales bacterium]|jgi:hypothetical protein|nr:hypothetical protein [Clostridiales bacterium]